MTSAAALAIGAALLFLTGIAESFALPLFLFLVVYLVSGLIEFLHYFYRGLSRSDIESTLTLWQRFGTLAIAVLVLALRPNVTALGAAMAVPVVLTLAWSLARALRLASDAGGAKSSVRVASIADIRAELKREVLPIGVGIVLSALYFRIDVMLLQFWSGTNAVGLYNAVFRLVEALRLFPAAVMAVALPILCRATTTRPLLGVSAAVTAFSFVVAAVLWFVADPLVPLVYGERYADAVPAFQVLVASFPLMSLNYALTHQLIGWNGHRAYAAVCAIALVFNVALNWRLIPTMSIDGAAWSTFWTEALLTVGCVGALWAGFARPGASRVTAAVTL